MTTERSDEHGNKAGPPASYRPDRVGRYELVSLLGQGGMASVHIGRLAGPAGFEKLVAVKIIHPHLLEEREFISMFLDEARISACIQHPNVAAVTEMGEEDGLLYMVGELVQGESLRSIMRRAREEQSLFPRVLSAHVVARMCDGLHAAHELTDGAGRPLGIVHRDVSPQNVLVSYSGHVKLIDFGVAQARDRITHTRTGTIKGKIGYLSPEQLRSVPIDRRSDVFSAGVVLYQLLTGSHPFPGDSDLARLERISKARFILPRELEPSVPADLERIAVKALALDPADRFPSAAAMSRALGEWLDTAGERIDSSRLSAAMKWLFSREIEAFAGRLEIHREKSATGSAPRSHGMPESRTSESWVATGYGGGSSKSSASGSRRWVTPVLAACALMGGLTLALFLLQRVDETPSVSPAVESESTEDGAMSGRSASELSANKQEVEDVSFHFRISPDGARIRLNGKPLAAGTDRLLVPGDGRQYRFVVESPGYRTREIIVAANGDRLVEVELSVAIEGDAGHIEKEPEPPAVERRTRSARQKHRRKSVTSEPWAQNPF